MLPAKETPTAPPLNDAAAPPAAPVTTPPPVAGYPIQQIPLQGVPTVQSQPYPTAYPQNYQQQYHATQPGQIVIYPTSQTTPLMGDANGIELQQVQHTLHQQQQQQRQAQHQQRRKARSVSSISIDSDDCDGFCCCLDVCNDCCCCCCSSIFDLFCSLLGKIFGFLSSLMAFIVIAWLVYHFFFEQL